MLGGQLVSDWGEFLRRLNKVVKCIHLYNYPRWFGRIVLVQINKFR